MAEIPVKIGIVGFGTVGTGVVRLINEQADFIAKKTGLRLIIGCVVDIDTESKRPIMLPPGVLTSDLNRLLSDDSIKIGIELVGGTTVELVVLEVLVEQALSELAELLIEIDSH